MHGSEEVESAKKSASLMITTATTAAAAATATTRQVPVLRNALLRRGVVRAEVAHGCLAESSRGCLKKLTERPLAAHRPSLALASVKLVAYALIAAALTAHRTDLKKARSHKGLVTNTGPKNERERKSPKQKKGVYQLRRRSQ